MLIAKNMIFNPENREYIQLFIFKNLLYSCLTESALNFNATEYNSPKKAVCLLSREFRRVDFSELGYVHFG